MTPVPLLTKLSRAAALESEAAPAMLPLLLEVLFDDAFLSLRQRLSPPMSDLVEKRHILRQRSELEGPLAAIRDLLRDSRALDSEELSVRLQEACHVIEAHRALFFLPEATAEKRCARLPLFTPMAVIHLSILRLLPSPAFAEAAHTYLAYAHQAVADALAWRTDQLKITCTPMRSAIHGGPNLQIVCVDTRTGQTIVDEMCSAYPGTLNPLLQSTVDRIRFYEERLHWKSFLFWEHEVLEVLSEWKEDEKKEEKPAPIDRMAEHLDDALYLIMQDIGNTMTGL
ncbi:hypothetical protein [Desulfoluna sp.]|uniref:hypothetical protein n=1 Tax=Desulfoluna sp. TaxID=2045199 RepID=UPI00260A06D9|nr:hypothetical protein [Desulfoluna sp.]